MKEFGERLQRLRRMKGLSQEQLAAELHVSRQAISKWEQGNLPETETLISLAAYFEVSLDFLLLGKENDPAIVLEKDNRSDFTQKLKIVLGIIAAAFGFLGNFVIYILSRFIEVPITIVTKMENGVTNYRGARGFSFRYFVENFNLELLVIFFILLLLVGLFILIRQYVKTKKETE